MRTHAGYSLAVAVDVFEAVPTQELRQSGRRRTFDRGDIVFHREDPGDSLHRVERGRFAARIITPVGDVATISLIGEGEIFGVLAVIGPDHHRTATIVALERSETLAIPASVFQQLAERHPAIRTAMERLVAEQLAKTSNRLVEALYTPVAGRVRNRLEELAEMYGDPHAGEVVIPLGQEHIAGLAGTTRETVNRILKQEEARGTLRLSRNRIVVIPSGSDHLR